MKTSYVDEFEYGSFLSTLSSSECHGWFDVLNYSVYSQWTLQLQEHVDRVLYIGFSSIFIHNLVIWIKTLFMVNYFTAIRFRRLFSCD